MGILHSTIRFMVCKQRNEEDLPICCGDSAERERPPKPSIFSILIYKAISRLLRRVGSIFSLVKRRKAADPLLPVQDPAASILTQPLILQTPPISPTSTPFDDEELECEDGIDQHVVMSTHDEMVWADVFAEEDASRNVCLLEELSSTEGEEQEEDIKSVIVVSEERWIKHYSNRQRILLVGEGDFSFSACLAVKFQWAPNIIATSLDSQAFLEKNYGKALRNIEELRSRDSKVIHAINVGTMAKHEVVGQLKYDRIIFNFPYADLSVVKNMARHYQLWHHQRLVSMFIENAMEMISENGEIHITHKTNGFHGEWRVVSLALERGLRLIQAVKFNHVDYPGYNTKCGFGGDKYFNCNPSKTYKFGF